MCDLLVVFHCNSIPIFYRFGDTVIENLHFCLFYSPNSRLKPSFQGVPWNQGMKLASKTRVSLWATRRWKPRDPMSVGFVFTGYHLVPDEWTAQPVPKSHSNIADSKKSCNKMHITQFCNPKLWRCILVQQKAIYISSFYWNTVCRLSQQHHKKVYFILHTVQKVVDKINNYTTNDIKNIWLFMLIDRHKNYITLNILLLH